MKIVKYFLIIILMNIVSVNYAQVKDTTLMLKVSGACEQCKARIEKAAKAKGVSFTEWNMYSHILTVVLNPSVTTITDIRKMILSVGHDVDGLKASDKIYNSLPGCCHYRESESAQEEISRTMKDTMKALFLPDQKLVKGIVIEETRKGDFLPLSGASVIWLDDLYGVTTSTDGTFSIPVSDKGKLVVSYAGYASDTVSIAGREDLKIILASNHTLSEVTVTSKMRSSYMSALNPIRTEMITQKELFKAACCNLSESFETNPSVDVTYNDAVTGSRQIQLLGLSGNYTQLTEENLPGPRGIATPWGLNYIAGPWIESIQLAKGAGSVANGFESIAGQINVELKKPDSKEKLYANAYVNDFGKTDLNLNLTRHLSKKWGTALLLHDDFMNNKHLDFNGDGFRDLPTGNQFTFANRWEYEGANGLVFHAGIKWLSEDKTGGQVNFDPGKDKYTQNSYGLGIKTDRKEIFTKLGYVFPGKKYKSFGWQLAASEHRQYSYFGLTKYDASQKQFYSNFIYQSIIGNTNHKFKTGFSVNYDKYNEGFKDNLYRRTEIVPGIFGEYTYSYLTKLNVVAGIRIDNNNLYGWFATPRLHIRYEPVKGTTVRLSVGRGQRTANIFAENMAVFVSARQVSIIGASGGNAYGLLPEIAWNKGIGLDQKIRWLGKDATLGIDFFRTDFQQQVVVDMENPAYIKFYNLQGKSYSNSLQAELSFTPFKFFDARLAYRFYDVKATYGGKLLQRPLVPANRAFVNLGYSFYKFKLDYTASYTGTKRIPGAGQLPTAYSMPEKSPGYMLMNAQLSRTVFKKHPMDVYLGGENLLNYYQSRVILSQEHPFGPNFDASLIWGPVSGRMFYAGFRFKLI